MSISKKLAAVFLAALAGTQASACTSESAPPESSIPYANVWSADTGIDLFSREAELVRATHESGWLVYNAGMDYAYDGYAEAVSELASREPTGDLERDSEAGYLFTHARDSKNTDWPRSANETQYSHITSYTAAGSSITATVCRYVVPTEGVTGSADRTEFARNMSVVEIQLANSSNKPGRAGLANRDPNSHDPAARRPPQWNVFGSWKITSIRRVHYVDPEGCEKWFRQRIPGLEGPKPGSKNLTITTDVKIPPQPVEAQYPEWIGPST
ncbi:hypothetical protein [Nocardia xishanensis]